LQRSIPIRLLLLTAISGLFLVSGEAYCQKKKPKKEEPAPAPKVTSIGSSLEKSDSLIVKEFVLPLSDSADDRPVFSLDGNIMVFGSRRPPTRAETWRTRQGGYFGWDGDIYYRVFTDTGWSIPINAGPQINDGGDQNNPTISPNGDEIVFRTNGQICRSKFINGTLQKPELIPGDIQGIYMNLQNKQYEYKILTQQKIARELNADTTLADLFQRAPDTKEIYAKERLNKYVHDDGSIKFWNGWTRFETAFSPDGKTIIFSENFGKKGEYGFDGEGDDDLWAITVSANGRWDNVVPLNGKVNSPFSESYPYLAADGATLYFSSNRPCEGCAQNAGGGDDIYVTRLTDKGFSKPVPLPAPINSPAGDYGLTVSPDGQFAYFVSNRTGKSKFYQVRLRSQDSTFLPNPIILVHGVVTDQVSGKPIRAQIFVDELTQAKNSFSVYTNDSGVYTMAVQRGHRFGLEATADKHLPKSERFTYPATGKFNRSQLDFQLAAIEVGASTEFKNVYFDFGKATLLKDSHPELDRVVDFLNKNKNASIEIDGHTDDVGSAEANDKLSLDRATSVMAYLSQHGVRSDRMTAKGFGKTKPLKKGTDEESRAKNRRVEMMISSYAQ
jgi:outer membrane protein OmpA-like peptidoglycan-associated protein